MRFGQHESLVYNRTRCSGYRFAISLEGGYNSVGKTWDHVRGVVFLGRILYGVRFTWRRGQGCSKHPMPIFLLLERTAAHGYVTWISHSSRKTGSTRCGYPNWCGCKAIGIASEQAGCFGNTAVSSIRAVMYMKTLFISIPSSLLLNAKDERLQIIHRYGACCTRVYAGCRPYRNPRTAERGIPCLGWSMQWKCIVTPGHCGVRVHQ